LAEDERRHGSAGEQQRAQRCVANRRRNRVEDVAIGDELGPVVDDVDDGRLTSHRDRLLEGADLKRAVNLRGEVRGP